MSLIFARRGSRRPATPAVGRVWMYFAQPGKPRPLTFFLTACRQGTKFVAEYRHLASRGHCTRATGHGFSQRIPASTLPPLNKLGFGPLRALQRYPRSEETPPCNSLT